MDPPAHQLRQELIHGIDNLNPGEGFPFPSPQARSYNLLHLHFVEGLKVQEIANELGISDRQAYRDLRHAINNLAAFFWTLYPLPGAGMKEELPSHVDNNAIPDEILSLIPQKEVIDMTQMIDNAWNTVKQLATRYNTSIQRTLPPKPVLIKTNSTILQQILINLMSSLIKISSGQTIRLTIEKTRTGYEVVMIVPGDSEGSNKIFPIDPAVDSLIKLSGWSIEKNARDGVIELGLHIPVKENLVLVIDDTEGFIQLIERFLSGNAVHVISARSSIEGLKMVESYAPDAVILDVMMANLDGWEVLQRVRSNPISAGIPIVICSVIKDSELALSLGATQFLAKPVEQAKLLATLREMGII